MFDQIRVEQTGTDSSNMPDFVIHELSISCDGIARKVHHYQYVSGEYRMQQAYVLTCARTVAPLDNAVQQKCIRF